MALRGSNPTRASKLIVSNQWITTFVSFPESPTWEHLGTTGKRACIRRVKRGSCPTRGWQEQLETRKEGSLSGHWALICLTAHVEHMLVDRISTLAPGPEPSNVTQLSRVADRVGRPQPARGGNRRELPSMYAEALKSKKLNDFLFDSKHHSRERSIPRSFTSPGETWDSPLARNAFCHFWHLGSGKA